VTPQSPGEVLEAVRRLEADLEVMRARARDRERDVIDLQATMAEDAARERQALVEDMERIVELVGASWRSTRDQVAALAADVAGLRRAPRAAPRGPRRERPALARSPFGGPTPPRAVADVRICARPGRIWRPAGPA
jgi:multidrug resistance efflux pump